MKYSPEIIQEIRSLLRYDAKEGRFYWLISVAKNVKAGDEAGGLRGKYQYIRVRGADYTKQSLAWALHYGVAPEFRVRAKDGDVSNLRIENLELQPGLKNYGDGGSFDAKEYNRQHRAAYKDRYRDADLQRRFGIDLAAYATLVAAQNNLCAICAQPETEMRNGKVKALAVDHNHETGEVRGLLCTACNQGLGKMQDSRDVLLSAVRYLDKHADQSNVVPLKIEGKA